MQLGRLARVSVGKSNGRLGRSCSDLAIGAGGVLLAASAVGVAVVQITSSDGTPKINGAEHLWLFARPMAYHEEKVRSEAQKMPAAVEAGSSPQSGVDYNTTASIARAVPSVVQPEPIAPAGNAQDDWRIRHVGRGRVTMERNGRIVILRVGERTPDGRRVVAVFRRDGQWMAAFRDDRRAQTSR